ncbi:MAG TPA: glycosyltransferase family 9 protein [Terriglobales bacterium]|nr:glycosyltransferase family 9 protein [Terriglobales bacterium]
MRLGAMGDVLHSLPAATALRLAFPEATVGWLIEERWAELLCTLPTPRSGPRSRQRPLVDRLHVVDTKRWREDLFSYPIWNQIAAGLSDLRAANYEVAVDLQGAFKSAILARLSGAPMIYGAAQPRENVASMFYTHPVITRGAHVVEQNLSVAEAVVRRSLMIPQVQLPCDEKMEKECELRLAERGIENFALLNPGAGWGAKQWPGERYAQVAKELMKDGVRSLVNFGPGEEDLARGVECKSDGAALAISGSPTQLIALTRRASLFIGGDTGPLHLAGALRVPVVGIFGPTNPVRNGPYGTRTIVLRSPNSSTSHKRRSDPDEGILEITADQVISAARQLLRSSRG